MLSIAWQFLDGTYRATDFADRKAVEWPPHPDRVYQALVATWAERGKDQEEREALEWLETLGPPALAIPDTEDVPDPVGVFVPVNDPEYASSRRNSGNYPDSLLGIMPDRRSKKLRYFPHVYVGDGTCALIWNDVAPDHISALSRLCHEVIRIGHSSSLVRCWLDFNSRQSTYEPMRHHKARGIRLRIPTPGRFDVLVRSYSRAESLKTYSGTPKAVQVAYRRAVKEDGFTTSPFSSNLLVWKKVSGPLFGLEDTLALTDAFRGTLIPPAEEISPEVREIVSGHAPDGKPLDRLHMAYLPLGYVGGPYSDGHIMGMALALPGMLDVGTEDDLYKVCAKAADEDGHIFLKLGNLGVLELEMAAPYPLQKTLRSETWAGPATRWASVTPVVMDKMQHSRRSDPYGWACRQVAEMCVRAGLPEPVQVDVGNISFWTGARPVHNVPPLRRKDGTSNRMIHVVCEFRQLVHGPVVIGAGRYRGYGLFKPVPAEGESRND